MKKFLMLLTQTAFLLSSFYLIACAGAIFLNWLLEDYSRLIAFMIVNFYIVGRFMYREML